MFSSYWAFVFIFNVGFQNGHVILLHVWHCALMFYFSKHMFPNLLLYLCHHASHPHSHNVPQLIHLPLPFSSVSLSLLFSCANCIANCNGFILGQAHLYTFGGLFSISLISFIIFLWYSSSFFLIYMSLFLSNFSNSYSHFISHSFFLFCFNISYL